MIQNVHPSIISHQNQTTDADDQTAKSEPETQATESQAHNDSQHGLAHEAAIDPKSLRHEVLLMAHEAEVERRLVEDIHRLASQERALMSGLSRPVASEESSQTRRHPSQTKPHCRNPICNSTSSTPNFAKEAGLESSARLEMEKENNHQIPSTMQKYQGVADVKWKRDASAPSECDVSESDSTAISCFGVSLRMLGHFRRCAQREIQRLSATGHRRTRCRRQTPQPSAMVNLCV